MAKKNTYTILLVEDEDGFRKMYRDVLELEGHTVLEAADGEKGLQMAKLYTPDLILLDIVLPKRTGLEVLKILKAETLTFFIPVIMFSVFGLEKEGEIQHALEIGAADYIVKGLSRPRDIIGKLKQFLEE